MTKKTKDLAWLLLQNNHYLLRSINSRGKEVYKIMKGKQEPVQYFSAATYRSFHNILKTDAKKRMTINLSAVRQLNGNSYIKKLYKQRLAALKPPLVEKPNKKSRQLSLYSGN